MTVRDHFDQLLSVGITAPIAPLLGLLIGWWGSYLLIPTLSIAVAALVGVTAGLLVDVIFWRRIVNIYSYTFRSLLWVYLFYSIGVFGFFMGVPLCNAFVGIIAGYVAGRKLADANPKTQDAMRLTVLMTTTLTLFLFCISAAILALRDPYTAANLKGMLALSFLPSHAMIWALILIGGMLLLSFQEVGVWRALQWGMKKKK